MDAGERPHTMTGERPRWSDASSSGRVEVPKESVDWTSRERFPTASTVGPDLGKRRVAQRFPGLAVWEEVGKVGSSSMVVSSLTRMFVA